MTTAMREPEWVSWATGEPPTLIDTWDGAPSVLLAPTRHGAILLWQFDQGADDSRYFLVAHLTDAEAQRVFTAPWTTGVLEPVRATLYDDRAVIARRHPSGCEAERLLHIPRGVSADEFVRLMRKVAEDLSYEKLPHPEHVRGGHPRESDGLLDRLAVVG